MNEQERQKIEELEREILKMMIIQKMIANVPKDEKGNVVADIVGMKHTGLFYLFQN